MFGDPLFWILVLPGLLLGVYAQSRIKVNIAKYSQVRTKDGITGAQVARRLLDSQGLQAVTIESTPGMLSDHYDPRSKTLRLSQEVYFAPSVAAAGIAAHETGHALQDAVGYFPLEARTSIVPLVQLALQTAPWLFIVGTLLQYPTLAWVGIILFGSSSLFALITLPVEFNASARARELLVSHGIIRGAGLEERCHLGDHRISSMCSGSGHHVGCICDGPIAHCSSGSIVVSLAFLMP